MNDGPTTPSKEGAFDNRAIAILFLAPSDRVTDGTASFVAVIKFTHQLG